MLDWTLTTGPLPIIVLVLAAAGFGWLLFVDRGDHWWSRRVPIAVGVGLLVMVATVLFVDQVWKPFPDPLPTIASLAVILIAFAVALAALQRVSWRRRIVSGVAVLVVALAGGSLVNNYFSDYLTVRELLGLPAADQVDFDSIVKPGQSTGPAASDTTTSGPMPSAGEVTSVAIPGPKSGFVARDAVIYLPPAYGRTSRPLPVLPMMAGQPGAPDDWMHGPQLSVTLDAYAAAHGGLAPVVVVADQLGAPTANPLCVDSPNGKVFTYLTVDVPEWIRSNLGVDPDHRHWAAGGLSAGGTCGLELALRAPDVYAVFVDLSGEDAILNGSQDDTVAWQHVPRVQLLTLLAAQEYPNTSGVIGVGADDAEFRPQAQILAGAHAAGINTKYIEVPGAHTFDVWGELFRQSLPWVAPILGLPG